MRDKTHPEQVERWARYCKGHMQECQKQVNEFTTAQIEQANRFYRRLAKTPKGKQKIMQLKSIYI